MFSGAMARGAWGRERPGHNPLLWPEGGKASKPVGRWTGLAERPPFGASKPR